MNIEKQLQRLKIEDIIWIIYLFIILFSIYANYLNKKYLLHKNIFAKQKEKILNIILSLVVFFIYIYFLKISYDDYKNTPIKIKNNKKYRNNFINLISAILFLIAGLMDIYIAISDNSFDDEIGII